MRKKRERNFSHRKNEIFLSFLYKKRDKGEDKN